MFGHAHGLELVIEWFCTAVAVGWIVWLLIVGHDKRAQARAEAEWHQVHAMVAADDLADTRHGVPSYLDDPVLRAKWAQRCARDRAWAAERERWRAADRCEHATTQHRHAS